MALTVKDIMDLPSGRKLKLCAGERGLDNIVTTVEIADYEFDPDIGYDAEEGMETNGFIITSFLFAKDDPGLILESIRRMHKMGMAAVAFKSIIYDVLPKEVIAFAEKNSFPIFAMDRDLWFENIVFDIKYAVQFDDNEYLSEKNIHAMISGTMDRSGLDIILKGISLKMGPYVSAVYFAGDKLDPERALRGFAMLKSFRRKGLVVRYGEGIFLLITSSREDERSHGLIRSEGVELMGIDENVRWGMSDVHDSRQLDRAFRESWHSYVICRAGCAPSGSFSEMGINRILVPALHLPEVREYSKEIIGALEEKEDLYETACVYVSSGGDILKASDKMNCHQNTIRYRLGRIREIAGLADVTDGELYMQLKVAVNIKKTGDVIGRG